LSSSSLTNSELNDWVLIVENVGETLSVKSKEKGSSVLEGVCAVFGRMNNNRRVYEKEEYLPHLSYLKEKISKRQLVGDLDHPPHFDVSLKSASHIIEDLKYDGGDKVYIKLRILENTPNGKIAKALLDGGVQLSISSRAAGQVFEGGRVKLQRIFTYDLVGEPGFTEAILKQTVSESLKNDFQMITESYNHLKKDSFVNSNHLMDISESLNFSENFKVYKINKNNNALGEALITPQKNNTKMAEYVTREQMDQYSEVLKNQFAGIKKELKSQKDLFESVSTSDSGNDNQKIEKLAGFVNYLAEQLEGVVNYADYLSTKLNESVKYTEHVAEVTNNGIGYSNYLGEKLEQSVAYQEYLGEKLNQGINYSEYIKENLNKAIKYQNYLAEELDKSIQYTEYVSEGANRSIEFANYLSENVNANRQYSQYLAEKLGQSIGYTEYIAESLGNGTVSAKRNVLGGVSRLNESTGVDSLINKVDQVITEVKDNSAKAVLEGRYPFLKVMSEAKKKAFFALDTATKNSIVETLNGAVWFNEDDVVGIIESVINHKTQNLPSYIKFMPAEYKPLWNEMNEGEKNRIHAKSQLYTLNSPYQVKTFWDEMDLRGIQERVEIEKNNTKISAKINESQSKEGFLPVDQVVDMQRGYSQGYLETLTRGLQFRK
jgi:hypothetical protein